MFAGQLQVRVLEIPAAQGREILGAQSREFRQQVTERARRPYISETIERVKSAILFLLENDSRPGNPVCLFTIYEMRDNLARAPGVRSFVGARPALRKIPQQLRDHRGRALENRNSFFEVEIHPSLHVRLPGRMIRYRRSLNYFSLSPVSLAGAVGPGS